MNTPQWFCNIREVAPRSLRPAWTTLLITLPPLLVAVISSSCQRKEENISKNDDKHLDQELVVRPRPTTENKSDFNLSKLRERVNSAPQGNESIRMLSKSELIRVIESLNLPDQAADRLILPELFLALAQKDSKSCIDMLSNLPGEYYKTAISKAFPYLARNEPTALEALLFERDSSNEVDGWLMRSACESLGTENPEVALRVFGKMPGEKKTSMLGTMLLKRAAAINPSLVIDSLTEDPSAPFFTTSLREVLYTVLVKDPNHALEVIKSHPELKDTKLLAGIYTSIARQDPKLALNGLQNTTPDIREATLSRRSVDSKTYFAKLFSVDPTRAVGLLNGITPTEANSNLFQEAGSSLSRLPSGPDKVSAVRTFAEAIRPAWPEAAEKWIESLK